MLEIEHRYKIMSPENTITQLAKNDIKVTSTKHIIDKWYIPTSLHSRADHDTWFDGDHGVAYRVRATEQADGSFAYVLDSKQLTDSNNHNTFKEEVVMEGDAAPMEAFLHEKNYYNWLTIDKQRYFFTGAPSNISLTMDTVAGVKDELGIDTVLEVEYEGDSTRDEALGIIETFASSVDLKESDLFEKSLTVESMRILAQFQP